MQIWKRNLYVCWFGLFVAGVGMSQIAPVLPLYIKHLGVDNTAQSNNFQELLLVLLTLFRLFSHLSGVRLLTYLDENQ
jgi:MFS transporter, DHA1 family, multidrug resistance protein